MEINTIIAIASILLLIGILISMGIGRLMDRHAVKHSQDVMSRPVAAPQAQTTDRRADRPSVSAGDQRIPRWELDRTRVALMEELLYSGWTITDFRRERIFRGDNNEISAEVDAARKRLGIEAPELRTPIADRPLPAGISFYPSEPDLEYEAPPK